MDAVETRVFKSGNSAAVRLPAELAFPIGSSVSLKRVGDKLTIEPVFDPVAEKRAMRELIEEIEAIWRDAPYYEIQEREPIEFPERPEL